MRERLNIWQRLVLITVFLAPFCAMAQSVILSKLVVKNHQNFVRLVIEAKKPFQFREIYLEDSSQLVIDVNQARFLDEAVINLWKNKAVDQIRYAYRKNNQLRLVFNLHKNFSVQSHEYAATHEHGYLVVLDFHETKKVTPVSKAKQTNSSVAVNFFNDFSHHVKQTEVPVRKKQGTAKHLAPVEQVNFSTRARRSYKQIRLAVPIQTKKVKPITKYSMQAHMRPVKKSLQDKVKSRLAKAFNPKEKVTDIRLLSGRKVMVVIDPGHGGKDPGAIGVRGVHEKAIVLKIAKLLRKELNRQPGYEAVLTRSDDRYLTLRGRLEKAREHHADMFIAIHADAYMNHEASGASVYALSLRGATSEAARWLASKENESELVGGLNLTNKSGLLRSVLLNLSQVATLRASIKIGNELISSLRNVASLHADKVEQAAFVVLKSPDIPSVLVETGFISNRYEERKLSNRAYQLRLAKAIKRGVVSYFNDWPPRGTKLSAWKRKSYFSVV